jgi:SAM-dependent methyltransferase
MLSGVLYENRQRAEVFGDDAEQYDRSRPRYPDAMIEDLVGRAGHASPIRVLDVGCGTGIAGQQFAERGCAVLGVEADERMAAVARSHGLDVEVGRFETWNDAGRRFDLVTAGQSWHWVDPYKGAERAAEVLAPGGSIALFWNLGKVPDEVQSRFEEVYGRIAPGTDKDSVMIGGHDPDRSGSAVDGLRRCGGFTAPSILRFSWDKYYPAEEWLDQLQTHSDHRLLSKETIAALLPQLGEVIAAFGGGFTMSYTTMLITAARLADG